MRHFLPLRKRRVGPEPLNADDGGAVSHRLASWPGPWTKLDAAYHETAAAPTDTQAHLPTLRALASRHDRVVEFGVRQVVTTFALLAGRPKSLLSVDIEPPPLSRLMIAEDLAEAEGIDFKFRLASTLDIPPVACDFLFIDTLHTYTQLKAELARHADGVTKTIAFHDTVTFGEVGMDGTSPGLVAAIDEYLAEHPDWSVVWHDVKCNGLTVIERGE